jgi:hypothetical protein
MLTGTNMKLTQGIVNYIDMKNLVNKRFNNLSITPEPISVIAVHSHPPQTSIKYVPPSADDIGMYAYAYPKMQVNIVVSPLGFYIIDASRRIPPGEARDLKAGWRKYEDENLVKMNNDPVRHFEYIKHMGKFLKSADMTVRWYSWDNPPTVVNVKFELPVRLRPLDNNMSGNF